MTMRELFENLRSDAIVRFGTDDGDGWISDGMVKDVIDSDEYSKFCDRPLVNMYMTEGREWKYCRPSKPLKRGLAVIVEGVENGTI